MEYFLHKLLEPEVMSGIIAAIVQEISSREKLRFTQNFLCLFQFFRKERLICRYKGVGHHNNGRDPLFAGWLSGITFLCCWHSMKLRNSFNVRGAGHIMVDSFLPVAELVREHVENAVVADGVSFDGKAGEVIGNGGLCAVLCRADAGDGYLDDPIGGYYGVDDRMVLRVVTGDYPGKGGLAGHMARGAINGAFPDLTGGWIDRGRIPIRRPLFLSSMIPNRGKISFTGPLSSMVALCRKCWAAVSLSCPQHEEQLSAAAKR